SATGVRVADVETIGNRGGFGLGALAGADDLVVGRLFADTFQQGLLLQDCRRAHVADDAVSVAECHNCSAPGFAISGGSDHSIGAFVCTNDLLGVSASNSPDLHLGRAGSPRSLVSGSPQQGILLVQCSGAVLTNADVLGNGIPSGGHGVQVIGGVGFAASELRVEGNQWGGLIVMGGATASRIGPNVSTHGLAGASDVGFTVRSASAVTVVDCSFGPDHRFGARLEAEGSGAPADVTFCRCTIRGNREFGLSLSTSSRTLVCASSITGNLGEGIAAVGASLATGPRDVVITDSSITGNAGDGLIAQLADGVQVGPGNHIDDNTFAGLFLIDSNGVVVRDNLSIDRNRGCGIWIVDCNDAAISRTQLDSNRICGIWSLRCVRLAVGPDVAVRSTLGTGVELEGSDACRLVSSQITDCTAYAVHVTGSLGSPGATPHLLQSCLLADSPGLALMVTSGPPVLCQLCTIAGNLRGVDSGTNPLTIDSCIVWGNLVEDVRPSASGLTVRNTFQLLPPASGAGNTSADPMFVAPPLHDWRLQPGSPAIGYASGAIAIAPGALDAYDGPRASGPVDAGAYEVGPRLPVADANLSLVSSTMAHGGGALAFQVQYLPSASGMLSILCLQLGPPSGSFSAFGAVIPLAPTPLLLAAAIDAGSVGTLAVVPPGGLVAGALLWGGRIPASLVNAPVSLCAVALDGTPLIRAVSNVAIFAIQ
ncbi:MAG TPA: right-handed parallel beta-helix repeat-containing protein, partial [Planctomycetota bacterium]|nr:right-handed parallel beta-helix repeat-containing protein [Planctomycetota bacterium]